MIDESPTSGGFAQIESSSDESTELILAEYREIENVKLTVFAELDRGTMSMGELLHLKVGDVLPFPRPVGENIDLFAADILIGNAEILAVNEKLAVRVADVNRKLTSSQAKKSFLVSANSGSAPRIRKLGSSGL